MVAGALDDRDCARVADGEALAGHALEKRFAGDGAVKDGVADDDVVARIATEPRGGTDDHAAAGQTLTDIVVAVTGQLERHAMGEERGEALAGGAVQAHED